MEVILYSTGCPRCRVLEAKLGAKRVPYTVVSDVDSMLEMGIESVPVLSVDGALMDFASANVWINNIQYPDDNQEGGCEACKLS